MTREKEHTENNQKLPRLGRMRCEKCGTQLFLTQPFTYRRQSYKFFCLRCYDEFKRKGAIPRETVEEPKVAPPQPTKHEVSEVPTMDDFMRPILEYASKRSYSFALREITDAMADHFNLSSKARNQLTAGGNIDRVYDRTSWSISHLKHAEFLRRVGRGRYEITDAGRRAVKSSSRIGVPYLMQNVPAYQRWKQGKP